MHAQVQEKPIRDKMGYLGFYTVDCQILSTSLRPLYSAVTKPPV